MAAERKDFAAASRLLAEAREYYTRQKQKSGLWAALISDARVRLVAGEVTGMEAKVEEAAAGYRSIKSWASEVDAYALQAEAFLAQHKPAAAQGAIARGHAAFNQAREFGSRMGYRLASAKVSSALGQRERAARELHAMLGQLEAKNWGRMALLVRQAMGD